MKFFDYILQGSDATEENALNAARTLDWQEIETSEENYPHLNYVDSANGVGVYYNMGSDDYYFTDETEDAALTESARTKIKEIISKEVKSIVEDNSNLIKESIFDKFKEFNSRTLAKKLFGKNGDIAELNAQSEVDIPEAIYDLFSEVITKANNDKKEVITIFEYDLIGDENDCPLVYHYKIKVNLDSFLTSEEEEEGLSITDEQRISQMILNHINVKSKVSSFDAGDGKVFITGTAEIKDC